MRMNRWRNPLTASLPVQEASDVSTGSPLREVVRAQLGKYVAFTVALTLADWDGHGAPAEIRPVMTKLIFLDQVSSAKIRGFISIGMECPCLFDVNCGFLKGPLETTLIVLDQVKHRGRTTYLRGIMVG